MDKFDKDKIKLLRGLNMEQFYQDIVSVQPIDGSIYKDLLEAAASEEDLKKEGYRPVSNLGLLWIKDKEKEDESDSN